MKKTLMRQLRRDRDLSIQQVSLATGINPARISHAERGLGGLTNAQAKRMAKFYRVDEADLLRDANDARAQTLAFVRSTRVETSR